MVRAEIIQDNMMWQVLDSVEKRRIGVLKSQQYHRRMCHLLGRQLRASESRRFEHFKRTKDADVRGDRLATISKKGIAQYEVVHKTGDGEHIYTNVVDIVFPVEGTRRKAYPHPLIPCVRWSPAGTLFTTSGTPVDPDAVRVMDDATAQVVETIGIASYGAQMVHTHEHSRLEPALIGIGTALSKVIVADLRTGNLVLSSGTKHTGKTGIHGIGWSLTDEHVLVSACVKDTFVWDTRYFTKNVLMRLPRLSTGLFISPHIQFLDANRVLVMANARSLEVYNVNTGLEVDCIDVFYRVIKQANFSRCKFALDRLANTVYYAVERSIGRYNLDTKRVETTIKGAHVWPIEMLLLNDFTKELYTMNGAKEAIVWTPFH